MPAENALVEVLVSWLPVILLVLVWAYFGLRTKSIYTGKSGKTHGEMLEEHVAELRRQNDLLEKVVKEFDERLQALETARQGSDGRKG